MAFYVPLIIMFATYALSVRILRRNHRLMKLIALGSVRRKGPKPPADVVVAATTPDAAGNRLIITISGSGQKLAEQTPSLVDRPRKQELRGSSDPSFPVVVKKCCLTFTFCMRKLNFAVDFDSTKSSNSKLSAFWHVNLHYIVNKIVWRRGICPRPRLGAHITPGLFRFVAC